MSKNKKAIPNDFEVEENEYICNFDVDESSLGNVFLFFLLTIMIPLLKTLQRILFLIHLK